MPKLRTYPIFISHSWDYNDEYYKLEEMLDDAPNFKWRNLSVPEHDSLDTSTDEELEEELEDQIRPSCLIIVLAGMYVNHRKWIDKEIDIALDMDKPILGIKPWGKERIPKRLQEVAEEIVGWNTSSIVSAIRRNAK